MVVSAKRGNFYGIFKMLVLANCGKFSFSFFGSREDLMQLFCVSFSIANLYTDFCIDFRVLHHSKHLLVQGYHNKLR